MARKYFCDGCDREIPDYSQLRCEWKICVENKDKSEIGDAFDLCEGCGFTLLRQADPRKWVRCASQAAE